ncbi:hypothetical protein DMH04_15205 [Kibdelosporangium aridum]|uniref:Uncharacterized protein n=1 Tax=Kibdelosporangium aridum TaxID=2030 RepID=A0A428ZD64_KIBAR|nr:hypothetical protein [Kibdelosporangium aridum]RSM86017.1 hypothetical protein DMH04_15205 [Kibdelosporangium aridum]
MTYAETITIAAWILALCAVVVIGSQVWRLTATVRSHATRYLITAVAVIVGFPLVLYSLLILFVYLFV